jgi:hypothetical protein
LIGNSRVGSEKLTISHLEEEKKMYSRAIFSAMFLVFGASLIISVTPQRASSQALLKPVYSAYRGV